VSEKITMLAPIPSVSDSTATLVTIGVALRDRTADRKSFIQAPAYGISVGSAVRRLLE
jgi:hypothetical protein